MGTAIASIIAAIIGGVTAGVTAGVQSKNLREAEEKQSLIAGREESKNALAYRDSMKMKREEAQAQKDRDEEAKRQAVVSERESRENRAYSVFEGQFGKIATAMSQNKQLEDLMTTRLKGLRG